MGDDGQVVVETPRGKTLRVNRLQPKMKGSHQPRFEAIRPWVEGKTVLDLGAACGMFRDGWLHGLVAEVAARTVAVDIDPNLVERMRGKGFDDVMEGDAEALDLAERFDVVLAAELIEHLANPGRMLESAKRHLNPGGHLVMTTPNAMAFTNPIYRLGKGPAPINPDHVMWFCEDTVRRLLERDGWTVELLGYIEHDTPGRLRKVAAGASRALLPDRLAWRTLMVVAQSVPE